MLTKSDMGLMKIRSLYNLLRTEENLLEELRGCYKQFPELKEEIIETANGTMEAIDNILEEIKKARDFHGSDKPERPRRADLDD